MITRAELEEILLRDDVVEYLSSKSKEEISQMFGENISRMIGFEQKNVHHCYDLMGHILHTVENVDKEGLSEEELRKLKVAAFFHDIGKPDVSSFNPKTGQQVFYGHASKSKEIAKEELSKYGYSEEEIANISFYIEHHDDFISYKSKVPDWMKTHEFIREINSVSVAEKILENKYDFERMGLDKDQIRYVCYYLAHNEEPSFTSPNGKIEIDVDMADVRCKMASSEYLRDYMPTKRDYELLTNICRADAKAQTELYRENGKVLCSRRDKLQNMDNIEKNIDEAYKNLEVLDKSLELDNMLMKEIYNNKELEEKVKTAEEIYNGFNEMDKKENLNHGSK